MDELPWTCLGCECVNMVNMDTLIQKRVSATKNSAGYLCEECGQYNILYYTTASLEDALKKMNRYQPNHKDFYWHFSKTLKKMLGVNDNG
jgi:uncharacterized protein YlaI